MDNQTKLGKLITFSPSADCELGRWILLYYRVNFMEERHAPPFFLLAIRLNGGKNFPLFVRQKLILDGARPLIDHFDDLAEMDRKLIPPAYAHEIEASWKSFNTELGGAVVTWAYANLLPHREIMVRPLSLGCPWHERFFVEHFYNIPKNLLWKALKLNKAAADKAFVIIQKKFSDVDKLIKDGRKYLFGDRMTLADMAFAVSGAPLVLPEGYGGYQHDQGAIPTFDQFPKELQEIISAMRQTPAGKFILRIYAEERYRDIAEPVQ